MPAIQVARTDTFEQQRQKINQIGNQIFSVTQGGSDLATGNLSLGNGSLNSPSLSFSTNPTTGIYRNSNHTIGFVSDKKLVSTLNNESSKFFNNTSFVKKTLATNFLSILSSGQNYDPGSYNNISVIGGTGIFGKLNITVTAYLGNTTSFGQDYKKGSYSAILLEGGTGSGSTFSFEVNGIQGTISDNGQNYDDGLYNSILLTGGSGTGATASFSVVGGSIPSVTINSDGLGYRNGDVLGIDETQIGSGAGTGFEYVITNYPGTINSNFNFTQKGSGYSLGDVLTLPIGIDNVSTNLNSSSSTITVTSQQAAQIRTGYVVTQISGSGILSSGGGPGGNIDITVFNISGTTISLSAQPSQSGSAVLNFRPAFGIGTTPFEYEILSIGPIEQIAVSDGGSGYEEGDTLSVSQYDLTQPISYPVTVKSTARLDFETTVSSSFVSVGDFIQTPGGGIQTSTITSSTVIAGQANNTYTNISQSSTSGSGSGAIFNVNRGFSGDVSSITIVNSGLGYSSNDTITILGSLIGGTNGTDNLVITINGVSTSGQLAEVYEIFTNGSNIDSIIVDDKGFTDSNIIVKSGTVTPFYAIDTVTTQNQYFIDYGVGQKYTPDLTFYAGNKYRLANSSNTAHPIRFSKFRDGYWSPSLIENIATTLDVNSPNIIVSNTTGILVGMEVSISGGGGGAGGAGLPSNVTVLSVESLTELTLSQNPSESGPTLLNFRGTIYSEGVNTQSSYTEILVTEDTPSPLYYFCTNHPNMGGFDNVEGQIIIDPNNPKIFGSGFQAHVLDIVSSNAAEINIVDKKITTENFESNEAVIQDLEVDGILTAPSITGQNISLSNITNSSGLSISVSSGDITATATNFKVGSLFNVQSSTGNLQTSGSIKTLNLLNVNDYVKIENNIFSSFATRDIIFQPASNRVVSINATSALIIPSGNTSSRTAFSSLGLAKNGAIRFNTDSNQYEGYNETTSSWSSLGGVRDIDGNTFIIAELTAGANDNTLWFYNDNNNTLRLTTEFLDFRQVKKISSAKLGIPSFSVWSANTPVAVGQYLKYRNNLYEVTVSGTTASAGNEPTHTSGSTSNGTAELTWYSLAVGPLEFTEIEEVRIGPNKDCPLIINSELKLSNNTISTLVNDLIISPNPGKKVVINSTTHFTIPTGNDNQKSTATAQAGSIRYNTTISQFEGYSGTNWSSLGGVRDVDGNTYIIPETAPGLNENILYFYNDGLNTLRLSKTTLDFTNIDTITTSGLGTLALDTPLVTLSSEDTTIDNRDLTRTFISTSKQYLDLGLSSGLVVDPVLRLDDQGDIYLNTGFGTGTYNGVKIFDGALKEFELADYAVKTATFTLEKGVANTAAKNLYNIGSAKGCQISVVSKSSTGKKSLASYNVIDNGSDIFYNEFGSLNSSLDGFTASFDITPENETRITVTLSNDHANGDTVEFTIITQVYK